MIAFSICKHFVNARASIQNRAIVRRAEHRDAGLRKLRADSCQQRRRANEIADIVLTDNQQVSGGRLQSDKSYAAINPLSRNGWSFLIGGVLALSQHVSFIGFDLFDPSRPGRRVLSPAILFPHGTEWQRFEFLKQGQA